MHAKDDPAPAQTSIVLMIALDQVALGIPGCARAELDLRLSKPATSQSDAGIAAT